MACCGEQQDVKKELEALEQYEKELQDALAILKQEDKVRVKSECDESKRKRLEERDRFIKDLKNKIKKNEELHAKQLKKGKDDLIARRIERVQLLEKELKEQILESEEKLKKELQKYNNNDTRREMKENELPTIQHNTRVAVHDVPESQQKSMKTTFEQTIQKLSNTITGRRVETELNQELSGNTEQTTTQKMSEEEIKLAELRKQIDQSLRERDEQIKSLKEEVQTRDSEIKELKKGLELQERSQSQNTSTGLTGFIVKHLPLKKKIDQLEAKNKTMSDQLQEAANALEREKKMKDTQLKEQEKHYEQKLKEQSAIMTSKILKLREENEELREKLKEAEASWKKEIDELRATHANEIDELKAIQAKDKEDTNKKLTHIQEETRQLFWVIAAQQTVSQKMEGMGQKIMEDMGQKLEDMGQKIMEDIGQKLDQKTESTNENLENVKQEVANLKKKIEPSAPAITEEAVTESNPTGASPYSIATQTKIVSDTNVEPYFDPPAEETGVSETTELVVTNAEDDKK